MTLEEQRRIVIADLDGKRLRQDWHGVRDACVEIEILDAKIATIKSPYKTVMAPFKSYFGDSKVAESPKAYRTCAHGWNWSSYGYCPSCSVAKSPLRCKYTAGDRCIRTHDHDGDHHFT